MSLDKVVSKIVGLGVPGLVLVGAMATSGFAGAAALTVALATLGGPLGMLGGVAVLGILLLLSQALTEFGHEKVYSAVIRGLFAKNMTKAAIRKRLKSYPIGDDLRATLEAQIKRTPIVSSAIPKKKRSRTSASRATPIPRTEMRKARSQSHARRGVSHA